MTSKVLNSVVELNKINYDSTNNRINFSTGVSSNNIPVGESAGQYANLAYAHANAAFVSANNVAPQVQPAFTKANAAFDKANSAVSRQSFLANTGQTLFITNGYNIGYVDVFVNGIKLYSAEDFTATDGANVSIVTPVLTQNDVVEIINWGGTAEPIARVDQYARDLSNVSSSISNTAIINANLSYVHANAAYNVANTLIATGIDLYARSHANAAFDSANNVAPQIQPAFDKANAAFLQANSAYNAVNTLSQSSISNGTSNVSVASSGNITVNIAGYTTEIISANLISRTEGVLDNTLFRVNSKNVTSNITISNTYNYMSVGPIAIANGITVTIDSNAYWTIV